MIEACKVPSVGDVTALCAKSRSALLNKAVSEGPMRFSRYIAVVRETSFQFVPSDQKLITKTFALVAPDASVPVVLKLVPNVVVYEFVPEVV